MNNVLHFLKLTLDAKKLIGFQWVLPLTHVSLDLWEVHRLISSEDLIENTGRLERLTELHDQFVEKGGGRSLRVFVVGHCRGSYAVKGHPAVTLSNSVL